MPHLYPDLDAATLEALGWDVDERLHEPTETLGERLGGVRLGSRFVIDPAVVPVDYEPIRIMVRAAYDALPDHPRCRCACPEVIVRTPGWLRIISFGPQ